MYQPGYLSPLIVQAQLKGDKDVEYNLRRAQAAMDLANHIARADDNVRLAWRGATKEITLDEMNFDIEI